ncbi:MAG: diadenylate cyclase CdaA [Ignavibacteriales bacterium]|nr:diadenylate cyclase CdaA [Ignavibacteriales bacterium]MCF8435384.1 diadenylate cyclase CdaA [Ignavibacteriales bacterium]
MFEIFRIGFISFSFLDFLDIVLVTLVIYKLYTLLRGTIAAQIFIGLMVVVLLSFLAQAANLRALGWLLKLVSDIWVIAFIILFQPEIRRLLVLLGRTPFFTMFIKTEEKSAIDILTETAFELSQQQHGALIVIIKSSGIRGVFETGEQINAKLTKNLLRSIFYPRSPLHDGAVVVKNDMIEAARCTLPLTQANSIDGYPLGMRHRAGVGISEQADVISIIVSEETGSISISENGQLKRGLSRESFRNTLFQSLKPSKDKKIRSIFEAFSKK